MKCTATSLKVTRSTVIKLEKMTENTVNPLKKLQEEQLTSQKVHTQNGKKYTELKSSNENR
jgi:hypothetical protein